MLALFMLLLFYQVDDKYKFMANTTTSNAGAADDAWDD